MLFLIYQILNTSWRFTTTLHSGNDKSNGLCLLKRARLCIVFKMRAHLAVFTQGICLGIDSSASLVCEASSCRKALRPWSDALCVSFPAVWMRCLSYHLAGYRFQRKHLERGGWESAVSGLCWHSWLHGWRQKWILTAMAVKFCRKYIYILLYRIIYRKRMQYI